jgi:hypothetical protein
MSVVTAFSHASLAELMFLSTLAAKNDLTFVEYPSS